MRRLNTVTPWIKASASADNGNCVEFARLADGGVAMRDSKDPEGLILDLSSAWHDFLASAKSGAFDGTR